MVHPRVIEIDIKRYTQVFSEAKAKAPDTQIMAVVKANAYGLGAVKMATEALRAGASFLGVATPQEALDLISSGLSAPILLLSEPIDRVPLQVIQQQVRFTVYSASFIQQLGQLSQTHTLPIFLHLKVNTGMNRLGARPEELDSLLTLIDTFPHLKLEGLMTHFACADTATHPANNHQFTLFQSSLDHLTRQGKRPPLIHTANSDAFSQLDQVSFNMVRLGLSTYRDCVTLKTTVCFLHQVQAQEGISYGWLYTADRPAWIATLPFGYADGISSRYGLNGGQVLIKGVRYPIVGKVCMDMMMVNLGDNPDQITLGDTVTIFGGNEKNSIFLHESANWAQRNEYEMLCGLGPRVERKYMKRG